MASRTIDDLMRWLVALVVAVTAYAPAAVGPGSAPPVNELYRNGKLIWP